MEFLPTVSTMLDGETSVPLAMEQASALPFWPQGSRSKALAISDEWAPPMTRMYWAQLTAMTVICTQLPDWVARQGTVSNPLGSVRENGLFRT